MRSIMIISFLTLLCLAFLIGPAASEEGGHICFRIIDANQDGEVTYEEFSRYFSTNPQKFLTIVTNKDGVLTHDEYPDMLGHRKRRNQIFRNHPEANVKQQFHTTS